MSDPTVKVSKKFLRDFAYLANYYQWEKRDIDEMKEAIRRGGKVAVSFYSTLADAHRDGYSQNATNNYQRLGHWCQERDIHLPCENERARNVI